MNHTTTSFIARSFSVTLFKWYALIAALILPGLLSCSDDADITITTSGTSGSVYTVIAPQDMPARLSIVARSGDTLRTAHVPAGTGFHMFEDIPFGDYTMVAEHENWFGTAGLNVDRNWHHSFVNLNRFGRHLSTIYPRSVIDPHAMREDSVTAIFRTTEGFRIDTAGSTISLSPPLSPANGGRLVVDQREILVKCLADTLFRYDSLYISFSVFSLESPYSPETITHSWRVDSNGLNSIRTAMLIDDHLESISREGPVVIDFNQPMNKESFEENLIIHPWFEPTYFWENNRVSIMPPNSLPPWSEYTFTIGTKTLTADSVPFRIPLSLSVQTRDRSFFRYHYPRTGAEGVPLQIDFVFNSYYDIDHDMLRRAFTIAPNVDSLRFYSEPSGTVNISHAGLAPATEYTITIDSSFTSRLGTPLGKELTIDFITDSIGVYQ